MNIQAGSQVELSGTCTEPAPRAFIGIHFASTRKSDIRRFLIRKLALRKSGRRDFAADWRRLMKDWEAASASYGMLRRGDAGKTDAVCDGAAVERARRNLIEIKRRMDDLISTCAARRSASPEELRFVLLEAQTNSLAVPPPSEDATPSDQRSARYKKR